MTLAVVAIAVLLCAIGALVRSRKRRTPPRAATPPDRDLGPLLYDGPPFEVDITYEAPKMVETHRSTFMAGGQEATVIASHSGSEVTQRRVRVERIYGPTSADPRYIVGYCHLRQDERAFRVHRIRELHDSVHPRPVDSPSWFLRQRIAAHRGEPPRLQRNESVMLARGVGAGLVICWRRQIDNEQGQSPSQTERIEIYDVKIDNISHEPTGLRICGPAKRRPHGALRAWAGTKTFDLCDCAELRTPDNERISDPEGYVYGLIGMSDPRHRPNVNED